MTNTVCALGSSVFYRYGASIGVTVGTYEVPTYTHHNHWGGGVPRPKLRYLALYQADFFCLIITK